MFVKVKVSLQQVLGHSALLNTHVFQDMKPACQRLTIFQKLEIVRYADALIAESRKQADDKVEKPASKKHIGARIRDWQKGVNIQSVSVEECCPQTKMGRAYRNTAEINVPNV